MTKNDQRILHAFEHSPAPMLVSEMARLTGMHRPAIYRALKRLERDGLVQAKEHGKRTVYFRPLAPVSRPYLPLALHSFVETYQGIAIQDLYRDMVKVLGKEGVFYRIESPRHYVEDDRFLPSEYFKFMCQQRVVEKFVITNEHTAKAKPAQLERYVRVLRPSTGEFVHQTTMILYGNRFAIIDFAKEQALVWRNAELVAFWKDIFDVLMRSTGAATTHVH